jgi:hypothetical protein
MPEDADENVFINVPGDNRGARVRYFDDVDSLARVADINFGLIERAFRRDRAIKADSVGCTFIFSNSFIEQLYFLASDMSERAALLEVRRKKVSGEDDE